MATGIKCRICSINANLHVTLLPLLGVDDKKLTSHH